MRTCRTDRVLSAHQVLLLVASLLVAPSAAEAIQLPSFLLRRPARATTTVAGLRWHTDYGTARAVAMREKKMLLVNFTPRGKSSAQRGLETYIKGNKPLQKDLANFVLVRVPRDAKTGGLRIASFRRRGRIIDQSAFQHLGSSPGLAIVDFKHAKQPYYGRVVTALPFTSGKYYRWQNSHLAVALKLPAGTITQRMMVWAVRIHPERPQSTVGTQHPALATAAANQSAYQAKIGVQGHHHWETRFHQVVSKTHAGSASEVVAESWENQDLIDSCIDCVQSWRHSSGHWRAVRSRQRLFGYDIRKGRNGIWYGTGIFAN